MKRRLLAGEVGLSLLELVVSLAVMAVVVIGANSMLSMSEKAQKTNARRLDLSGQQHRLSSVLLQDISRSHSFQDFSNNSTFAAVPKMVIKYNAITSTGVEFQRRRNYQTDCAKVDESIAKILKTLNWKEAKKALKAAGCNFPSCNFGTETIAVRRDRLKGWSGNSVIQSQCFPEEFAPATAGKCQVKPNQESIRNRVIGTAVCFSSPASKAGNKVYAKVYSLYADNANVVRIKRFDVGAARQIGASRVEYLVEENDSP